jgi:hypothetical protein
LYPDTEFSYVGMSVGNLSKIARIRYENER